MKINANTSAPLIDQVGIKALDTKIFAVKPEGSNLLKLPYLSTFVSIRIGQESTKENKIFTLTSSFFIIF